MRIFILIMMMNLACGQEFTAFDCDNATEAKFFRHSDCNRHHEKVKEYYLVQDEARWNVTGYKCEVHHTYVTGYCGHYSATKMTGSTVKIRKIVLHKFN